MRGSRISDVPENDNFATFFLYLKLKRECKQDYMKVEESKMGNGL